MTIIDNDGTSYPTYIVERSLMVLRTSEMTSTTCLRFRTFGILLWSTFTIRGWSTGRIMRFNSDVLPAGRGMFCRILGFS